LATPLATAVSRWLLRADTVLTPLPIETDAPAGTVADVVSGATLTATAPATPMSSAPPPALAVASVWCSASRTKVFIGAEAARVSTSAIGTACSSQTWLAPFHL
jgi:hypothetical protein